MIEALSLGFLSGAIVAALNFLISVKLFPTERILKVKKIFVLFILLFLIFFDIFVMRMCYVFFLNITGVEKGSLADHVFRLPMQWLWAASIILFFTIPVFKARGFIK